MKSIAPAFIFLTIIALVCDARPMRNWGYDVLATESDLIMIVSVSKVSEHTGHQQELQGRSYNSVVTKFKVQTVIKGNFDSQYLELNHLIYPKVPAPDALFFHWFSKKDETFVTFLKINEDGIPTPVTGQENFSLSFVSIERVLPSYIEPQ